MKKKTNYTTEQKTEILAFYKEHGLSETVGKFGVNRQTLAAWNRTNPKPSTKKAAVVPAGFKPAYVANEGRSMDSLIEENTKLRSVIAILLDD